MNKVELCGAFTEKPVLHRSTRGTKFYKAQFKVQKPNGSYDYFDCDFSEDYIDKVYPEEPVRIGAEIRDYTNMDSNGKKFTQYNLSLKKIEFLDEEETVNIANVTGTVSLAPIRRKSQSGKDFCRISLRVNRRTGYDYIYCSIINPNKANEAALLKVGDVISVDGFLVTKVLGHGDDARTTLEVIARDFIMVEEMGA